nr:protein ALP1-like [Tanacetum cinerariifolium]
MPDPILHYGFERINTPRLKTRLVLKTHGFLVLVVWLPRRQTGHRGKHNLCENLIFYSEVGKQLKDGVVRLIDFGNKRGCVGDDMSGCGLGDVGVGVEGGIIRLLFKDGGLPVEFLECGFDVAGANNDLTVLNHSPLFDDLLDDIALVAPFECNGVTFEKGYYLADNIYPQWSSFVKSFTVANSVKNALFKRKQESARKDVERAFGVLQGRWHIICQSARAWTVNKLRRVVYTCIILHSMILKD